jgi:putative holliday junction resolvase
MMQTSVCALGLDIGHKRIGVAGCDRSGLIATGLTTLTWKSFTGLVEQLKPLIKAREIELLVVGLPYTLDGQIGTQARQVQKLTQRLSAALDLPVEYVDERLTSFQAEQLLMEQGLAPSRNRALIDRKAAAIILQQWLDQRPYQRSDQR